MSITHQVTPCAPSAAVGMLLNWWDHPSAVSNKGHKCCRRSCGASDDGCSSCFSSTTCSARKFNRSEDRDHRRRSGAINLYLLGPTTVQPSKTQHTSYACLSLTTWATAWTILPMSIGKFKVTIDSASTVDSVVVFVCASLGVAKKCC